MQINKLAGGCSLIVMSVLLACAAGGDQSLPKVNDTVVPESVLVEIVIPAGRGGDDFLPLPVNLGRTQEPVRSGDVFLLVADALAPGSVVAAKPMAMLELDSSGVRSTVYICYPIHEDLRVIDATSYVDLTTEYEAVRHILQTWLINQKGLGKYDLIGWKDDAYATAQLFNGNNGN